MFTLWFKEYIMDCLVYSLKYNIGNIILDSSLFSLQTFLFSLYLKKI